MDMYKKLIISYCYELIKWITLAFIVYIIVLAVHSNQLTKRIENLENNLKSIHKEGEIIPRIVKLYLHSFSIY
mgnify:FL=1